MLVGAEKAEWVLSAVLRSRARKLYVPAPASGTNVALVPV